MLGKIPQSSQGVVTMKPFRGHDPGVALALPSNFES
jgi:hypothetical protein